MDTFEIDNCKIRELYDLCKLHKIKGYKKMSKQKIFDALKNKICLLIRRLN